MTRRGLTLGLTAHLIWGLFPLYWPLLEPADELEILADRTVWSLVFVAVLMSVRRQWRLLKSLAPRTWALVGAASLLISVNWGVYIYAVNNDHIVDAALGYFINPLFSVLIGVLVFGERLRPWQWVSVGLGFAAVLMITAAGGRFPWISVVLALTFALYGLVKKVVPLAPQSSLAAEGLVLLLPASAYLVSIQVAGKGTFTGHGGGHAVLLVLAGLVTLVPLLAFAGAARELPLSILGVIQYVTPLVQFLLGVLWAHEHMSGARWTGFVLIWAGLMIFTGEGLVRAHRQSRVAGSALAGRALTPLGPSERTVDDESGEGGERFASR